MNCGLLIFTHVHHDEPGSVPYLIGKVTAVLNSFIIETHIITGCVSCDQCQTKRICAVLINNFQRINSVSEGFAHLTSL